MPPDPEAWKKVATPALFARTASNGRWKMARHLQLISQELVKAASIGGTRLIITVPPRHGKSFLVSKYFPAWYLGVHPHNRIILCSFEADFAADWGRAARELLVEHGHLFGVKVSSASAAADRWAIEGTEGGMITAGARGSILGRGANQLIIDDPIKNYKDSCSETLRQDTWDWFITTAYTRLEPNASVVIMQQRWHEDDLVGRVLREMPDDNWKLINLPALAEPNDPLGRKEGEALWPERYSAEYLNKLKKAQKHKFYALYQQRPQPEEGNMFKRQWFQRYDTGPREDCPRVRAWDKAGTQDNGDYSAGVLMSVDKNGFYWIEDVIRGQWAAHERNRIINHTTKIDAERYPDYQVVIEQEPGSGGKEAAEFTIKDLAGFSVVVDKPTGAKDVRARPLASQAGEGMVKLVDKEWCDILVDELASFPTGVHDDMVDASAAAFNRLALGQQLEAWVM